MIKYDIKSIRYKSLNTTIYRATGNDGKSLILKRNNLANLNDVAKSRFKREYRIASSFNQYDNVAKVLELYDNNRDLVIIMEDIGAEALSVHMENLNLSLIEKIKLSIKMCLAVEVVHKSNTIHLDINPSNFVWNPDNDAFQLIDFGLSSQAENEIPEILNPNIIEGTIAYLAPEQSGRMNRAIDYRADLYSLGVSFYEVFTGRLPFYSENTLKMIHYHIAKFPQNPTELNPDIPIQLSEIILKLLSKSADLRYQSAASLRFDLQRCLTDLKKYGQVKHFEIAQNDHTGKYQLPQKLYSRKNEIKLLFEAFESACTGNTGFLMVRGEAGIGKSVLVGELHKQIMKKNGIFISGKFDELKEEIPFAALTQALNSLINQILSEPEEKITIWKKRILNAIDNNGKILRELVNNIELIIGKQPDIVPLDPKEAAIRNNIVYQNFMKSIAYNESPLVIFFDDLQWSNKPSLRGREKINTDSTKAKLYNSNSEEYRVF